MYDSQDALAQSSIDSSDVVIISSDALNQDLPWDLFSHVIEFESKTNSNITSYSDQVEYIVLVMRYGVKETPVEGKIYVQLLTIATIYTYLTFSQVSASSSWIMT